jgi:hypothetical protein
MLIIGAIICRARKTAYAEMWPYNSPGFQPGLSFW